MKALAATMNERAKVKNRLKVFRRGRSIAHVFASCESYYDRVAAGRGGMQEPPG
jgi:hypothetical protein